MLGQNEIVLTFANGARVVALAIWTFCLCFLFGHVLVLKNRADDVCSIYHNIICIGSSLLTNNIYTITIFGNAIIDVNKQNKVDINAITNKCPRDNPNKKYVWHLRLCYIGEDRINKLSNDGYIDSSKFESYLTCEACLLRKMTKAPFVGHSARAADILESIHTNVCEPINEIARGDYNYFITFIDDQSWYGYLYLMKYKSESFEKFKEFRVEVEKQIGKCIKAL